MTTGIDAVSYSVKELLAQQDKKLDRILDRIDSKADNALMESLEKRVAEIERHGSTHAVEAIQNINEVNKRLMEIERDATSNSYLVPQYLDDHKKLETIEDAILKMNNGMNRAIAEAIEKNNRKIDDAKQQMFSRKEKIFLVLFAGIGALGTIVSVVVLILQSTGVV